MDIGEHVANIVTIGGNRDEGLLEETGEAVEESTPDEMEESSSSDVGDGPRGVPRSEPRRELKRQSAKLSL